MALDQATRDLQISTPLGDNVLLLVAFSGQEVMSSLFRYQLSLISDDNAIAAADIVGKNITFSVALPDDSRRYFNGYVSRFFAGDEDENHRRNYRAEVVPWLWFLSRTSDCRIFQQKSVKQIVEQVFGDSEFAGYKPKFKWQVSGSHPQREYVVQYRESDLNFVSRLLEEEGIYYYFKHADGAHELVLADNPGGYYDCEPSEVNYPWDFGTHALEPHLTAWEHRYEFRTGKVAMTDYNFKTPSAQMLVTSNTKMKLPGPDKFEFFDYPGEYVNSGDGRSLADLRMEEEEVAHDVVEGASLCPAFAPGGKFKIKNHRSSSENGKSYVLTSVSHQATEGRGYEAGASTGGHYANSFSCIPGAVCFRPQRATAKPIVQGVQTAVVVGPTGEEIYTDEYGRVKVQFPWDRQGNQDENSSCWIRVSQNWAGDQWGVIFNPRIGQEVIVDFVEGDPDRPIITGRVYNAEQMPPYELPGEQTKSTIKSRSSKGGGPDNFNEIRFEDKMGSEEMYIHAEKDQNIIVENDRAEFIGRDRSLDVGRDKSEHVTRDKTIFVDGGHTETIGKSMTINVMASLTETIAANYAETVGAAMALSVGGALAITVGAGMAETVGGAKAENIGGSKTENIGTNRSVSTGGFLSENIGKDKTVDIQKDLKENIGGQHTETVAKEYMLNAKKINIVAKDEIQIKVGKAEITMKKNGDIALKGKNINVKGSGNVIVKGSQIKEN